MKNDYKFGHDAGKASDEYIKSLDSRAHSVLTVGFLGDLSERLKKSIEAVDSLAETVADLGARLDRLTK
jgi:hypothetical protein